MARPPPASGFKFLVKTGWMRVREGLQEEDDANESAWAARYVVLSGIEMHLYEPTATLGKTTSRADGRDSKERKRRASFAYVAGDDDEIDLREGDVLDGWTDLGGGWAQGRNARTGQVGTFPAGYVEEDEEEELAGKSEEGRRDQNGGSTGGAAHPHTFGDIPTTPAQTAFRPLPVVGKGGRVGHRMGFNAKVLRSGIVPEHIVRRSALMMNSMASGTSEGTSRGIDANGASASKSDTTTAKAKVRNAIKKITMAKGFTRRPSVKEKIAIYEDMKNMTAKKRVLADKIESASRRVIPSADHAPFGTLRRSIRLDRVLGIDELEDGATFSVLPAEHVAISVAAGANATDVVPLALRSASTEEHRGWIDALMSNVWQAELVSDRGQAAALRLQMCFRRWRLRKRCEAAAAKTKKKKNRRGKNKTSKRARRASFAYTAKDNDEINLEEGDVLEDLKDLGDGWAEGRNARTGEVGTFPSSYTDPVAGGEEEEGTRAKEDREDVTMAGQVPKVMSPSPQAPKVVARTPRAQLSPGAFFHESPPPVVRRKSPQKVDRGYDHM